MGVLAGHGAVPFQRESRKKPPAACPPGATLYKRKQPEAAFSASTRSA
jgi:hypothetical protein